MSLFENRRHAGRHLARELARREWPEDTIVLGLARGGAPVAHEVARELDLPFDVFIVRKLGVPFQPELAMGAIASGDVQILNDRIIRVVGLSAEDIENVAAMERAELKRREKLYRGDRTAPDLQGRTVILVDDGLATGASMSVAIKAVKAQEPESIVVACPVAPRRTLNELDADVDEIVCLATPDPFYGVGAWFADFGQTTDEDVRALLDGESPKTNHQPKGVAPSIALPIDEYGQLVSIRSGEVILEGNLNLPPAANGVVLFAHGSGSSRFSPRNRFVAGALRQFGLGTLLIDLLTSEEEAIDQRTRHLRFDIDLLTARLVGAVDWLVLNEDTQSLKVGLFGSSTGAAAALVAAARRPDSVGAVVSRGGRPDLAGTALREVQAPTLCLVGSQDLSVIPLNEMALEKIPARHTQMSLIPGATHLFSEPGTLEMVADQAGKWFQRFLMTE